MTIEKFRAELTELKREKTRLAIGTTTDAERMTTVKTGRNLGLRVDTAKRIVAGKTRPGVVPIENPFASMTDLDEIVVRIEAGIEDLVQLGTP